MPPPRRGAVLQAGHWQAGVASSTFERPSPRAAEDPHDEDGRIPASMSNQQDKLSLTDAVAMAVGGMVGGGIFAVLGEAIGAAGNATFLAFGLGGALALLTGVSYARLTLDFEEPGGSFSYVEHVAGAGAAGTVSWFLLLGYVFTVALYGHTFGAYGAHLVGMPVGAGPWLGAGAIMLLAFVNLLGVRESGITEDVLVYAKVGILVVVAGAGFLAVEPAEALPVFERSGLSVVGAAAMVFVAYEGFQLLTYDYDDIVDRDRNLHRAIWISIPLVAVLYMVIAFVTTGGLDDETISGHSETVLAYAARPTLGRAGVVAVLVAAVFSTASAINATLFAAGRLADRVAETGELPGFLMRLRRGGVPGAYLLGSAALAAGIQIGTSLGDITAFSSLVFLLVFAVVNATAVLRRSFTGWSRALPVIGSLGCTGAAFVLVDDLRTRAGHGLLVIASIAGVLLVLRAFHLVLGRRAGGS